MTEDEALEPRVRVPADRPWKAGYSRAIRVGDTIEVSGTVASDASGAPMFPTDMGAQVIRCLEIIGEALERLGSSHADVVRTRLFLTDISRWREAAAAHHQVFGDILPACSFIGISELLHPDFLVEIEATAIASRRAHPMDRSPS
jgi:enamine deaminase RidA (YjgF/YER057c/UK114 family)